MKTSRKSVWRFLFKFHRYAGLCTALFIVVLAVTGIALNHTEDFKLDSQFVKSAALLNWYGIKPSATNIAFTNNSSWIIQSGGKIYIGTQKILENSETLVGVVATESFLIFGFPNSLTLVSPEGEVIEKIKKPVTKIGIDVDETIFIISEHQILSSKDQLLSWQKTEQKPHAWSIPVKPPSELIQIINDISRENILPYERVILDIHSGRFFGQYGVIAVDVAGVLSILLALSGCWMWLRHKLRHHKSRKKL